MDEDWHAICKASKRGVRNELQACGQKQSGRHSSADTTRKAKSLEEDEKQRWKEKITIWGKSTPKPGVISSRGPEEGGQRAESPREAQFGV